MLSIDKLRTMNGCSKVHPHRAKVETKAKNFFDGCRFSFDFFPLLPPLSLGVKGPYTDEEL